MAESKRSDHWDLLASTLGTEPQKKDSIEPAQQAEESPPIITNQVVGNVDAEISVNQQADESPEPAPAPVLSSWDMLAMKLGVEVKPEPPPPPAPVKRPVYKPVEKKAAYIPPAPQEPEKKPFAEFSKEIETAEVSEPESADESDEQSDNKSRHRRRRRRKGREKDHPMSDSLKGPSDADIATNIVDDLKQSTISGKTDDKLGADLDEESAEEGEADKKHPKHRRSRRGSRKRKQKDSEIAEKRPDQKKAGSKGPIEAETAAKSPKTAGGDEFADDDTIDDGQGPGKAGFRAIPTWEESVGVIITKNLESRPRQQSSGPPRSRSSADAHKKRRR